MLNFLVTKGHDYTIRRFLSDWGRELADRVRVEAYSPWWRARARRGGTTIFADLERIPARRLRGLERRWQRLEHSVGRASLLNQPLGVKRRLELLRELRRLGINDFDAYPITPGRPVRPSRFPVFIRRGDDHKGPISERIPDQRGLDGEIERLARTRKLGRCPIVVEFVDASDDHGRYRKYAAFRVGEHIVPTHIQAGPDWVVRSSGSEPDPELVEEEWQLVDKNPHGDELMRIFRIARIEYGRIDYALVNGRIQVFEINTNPNIMREGVPRHPERLRRKKRTAEQLVQAFLELDARDD